MRRLLQWLFSGLCLLSLLACLGVCALWVRGNYWNDSFARDTEWYEAARGRYRHAWAALHCGGGSLRFSRGREAYAGDVPTTDPVPRVRYRHGVWQGRYDPRAGAGRPVPGSALNRLGFAAGRADSRGGGRRDLYLAVPDWFAAAGFGAAPLAWVRSWRGRRRRRGRLAGNYCRRCGYDLTGNASGVCSECGAKVGTERRMTA